MTDSQNGGDRRSDDMSEYLQTFLDETEEQLDDLVETLLSLEQDSTNREDLNEAFRLIHSIKGSAGMMGFDSITVLTHHLENRFERFRSGTERLDEPTMNLVLRCVDFLRQCNNRLRDGEELGSSSELLEELRRLEDQAHASTGIASTAAAIEPPVAEEVSAPPAEFPPPEERIGDDASIRLVVRFRAGLQLVDLKAQLIVARLAGLGEVRSTRPDVEQLAETAQLEEFQIHLATQEAPDRIRAAADVEGVESIEFPDVDTPLEFAEPVTAADLPSDSSAEPPSLPLAEAEAESTPAVVHEADSDLEVQPAEDAQPQPEHQEPEVQQPEPDDGAEPPQVTTSQPAGSKPAAKVAETMRVDIDRLDNLMNLVGELVVNRARFVQISDQIDPALRNATMLNRLRDFSETLRRTLESLEMSGGKLSDQSGQVQQLRAGLELLEEQSDLWDNGRQSILHIGEAIDQLARVSHSLQRGVLETRMVPVGPLFSRFKRVVRDLSVERGKRVNLQIRGEKTELDKRMIDELGDPLVHLVRNSIDHGLEPPDVRLARGKPEVGTISLEASHSGNNIYILVEDDGGGIDAERIGSKLIDKGILSAAEVAELSHEELLAYIWHPGFSTAAEVTDVSGRGVGMDVVKTRIGLLNGTIDVDSTPPVGTRFTLRLPLTLAIIDCLLVRMRNVIFSMPIDDVREIVSINESDVISVQGKQTFDIRGEFVPLLNIDGVFHWHDVNYVFGQPEGACQADPCETEFQVVIVHSAGKTMGIRVEELLGSQDIVIKSLSDNFMDIRGLAGASILGDGSVCLMLDVGMVIDLATRPTRSPEAEGDPV